MTIYSVSDAYKTAIRARTRTDRVTGTLTLTNGTVLNLDAADLMSGSLTLDNQCVTGEELAFGCAYLGQAALNLRTDLSRHAFYGAKLVLHYGLQLPGGRWETVPLGVYTVAEAERRALYVSIKAYDNILALQQKYDGTTMQGTAYALLGQIAAACGLTLGQTEAEIGSLNKAMLLWRGDQGYTNAPKDLVTMFYGGLLLYDTPLGSDPATVFAPAGAGVVGTAMAGQVNATKNTVRGSANLTETKIDPWSGVVTYVYEFATSQANGVIGSVCLTHPMGAYYSEMIDAPDAAACNADRLGFGGALGGDQLLTGLLAKTTYPTDEKGVLLYADPEADEAVAGYLNADEGVLELRHHALGLKTLDLFRCDPTGLWDSLWSTDTLDVADFLQVDSSAGEDYCRICFDAEADKIYLVSAPEVDYIDARGVVKIREYDRKTLAAKDYTVPNNTGVDLQSFISENRGTPLNGTVYGGSLYMVQDQAEQIYRFPLADPTDVQAVTMHGDDMAYLSDAHDGRLYCYYRTRAVVLNTGKNELFSCEAAGYDNTTSGFSTTAPVLGEPLTPLRRYYGDSRIRTERVLRANYLATINDLPKSVEKTADKTMKVIYTLRRGG